MLSARPWDAQHKRSKRTCFCWGGVGGPAGHSVIHLMPFSCRFSVGHQGFWERAPFFMGTSKLFACQIPRAKLLTATCPFSSEAWEADWKQRELVLKPLCFGPPVPFSPLFWLGGFPYQNRQQKLVPLF